MFKQEFLAFAVYRVWLFFVKKRQKMTQKCLKRTKKGSKKPKSINFVSVINRKNAD
jgi:hypothetical protein